MPNRILYPALLKSRKYNAVNEAARDLYVRLILLADDFGRFDGDPVAVARAAYPIDEKMTSKKVEPLMRELVNVRGSDGDKEGLIILYKVGSETYMQLTNWRQRTRATDSKYPPPGECRSNDGHMTDTRLSDAHVDGDVDGDGDGDGKTRKQKTAVEKKEYAEFVRMTEAEYAKLVDQYGQAKADGCISILDNYKGAKGVTYKSDYRAILNWVVKRYDEDNPTNTAPLTPADRRMN